MSTMEASATVMPLNVNDRDLYSFLLEMVIAWHLYDARYWPFTSPCLNVVEVMQWAATDSIIFCGVASGIERYEVIGK